MFKIYMHVRETITLCNSELHVHIDIDTKSVSVWECDPESGHAEVYNPEEESVEIVHNGKGYVEVSFPKWTALIGLDTPFAYYDSVYHDSLMDMTLYDMRGSGMSRHYIGHSLIK